MPVDLVWGMFFECFISIIIISHSEAARGCCYRLCGGGLEHLTHSFVIKLVLSFAHKDASNHSEAPLLVVRGGR